MVKASAKIRRIMDVYCELSSFSSLVIIASYCEIAQNTRERASDGVLAESLDVIDEAMPIICKKAHPKVSLMLKI